MYGGNMFQYGNRFRISYDELQQPQILLAMLKRKQVKRKNYQAESEY